MKFAVVRLRDLRELNRWDAAPHVLRSEHRAVIDALVAKYTREELIAISRKVKDTVAFSQVVRGSTLPSWNKLEAIQEGKWRDYSNTEIALYIALVGQSLRRKNIVKRGTISQQLQEMDNAEKLYEDVYGTIKKDLP